MLSWWIHRPNFLVFSPDNAAEAEASEVSAGFFLALQALGYSGLWEDPKRHLATPMLTTHLVKEPQEPMRELNFIFAETTRRNLVGSLRDTEGRSGELCKERHRCVMYRGCRVIEAPFIVVGVYGFGLGSLGFRVRE